MAKQSLYSPIIEAALNRISSDHTSGAAEILTRAGKVFSSLIDHASEIGIADHETAYQTILATCVGISRAQPDMSPLLRLASAALSAARNTVTATDLLRAARDAALQFIDDASHANRTTVSQAEALIHEGATVLTHSRSSTVLATLLQAKHSGRSFVVIATESRPMLEGRSLAASLGDARVDVILIADSAAAAAMCDADIILIGADKLTPYDVVNKIGTRMIALAARERSLPVFALCDTSKFIDDDYSGKPADRMNDPAELWDNPPAGVTPHNRYFEHTPIEYFRGIMTEDGLLSSGEARRRAERAVIDPELIDCLLR